MKTYTYSEARQRLARLLDQARREGRVQIRRQDGSTFVLQPVTPAMSPLDVPGVRSKLRPGELVELLRTERARSGEAIVEALSNKRLQRPKARRKSRSTPVRKK
jgi:hypothetical protein